MTSQKRFHLFISHSWAYGDAYDKLVSLINNQPNFTWSDYSVPKNDPIHNAPTSKELYEAIKNQVRPASCVIILAGVYSTYSEWINKEIKIAQELSKPVIGIEPWDAKKTSKVVKDNADSIVRWQGASIVNAIRELC